MKRIGLATDVPGVFGDGRVIPEITPAMEETLKIGDSGHADVTGGMKGKVDELLALAAKGIPSDIFHVSRIGDFLDGRPHGGTRVRRGKKCLTICIHLHRRGNLTTFASVLKSR